MASRDIDDFTPPVREPAYPYYGLTYCQMQRARRAQARIRTAILIVAFMVLAVGIVLVMAF